MSSSCSGRSGSRSASFKSLDNRSIDQVNVEAGGREAAQARRSRQPTRKYGLARHANPHHAGRRQLVPLQQVGVPVGGLCALVRVRFAI